MAKVILSGLFILILSFVSGQQRPQFTQFIMNKYYENPAYGGMDRSLSVNLQYRDQNSSLTGNPKNFNLSAHMPFYLWNGAVGFQIFDQRIGLFGHTGATVSYNYVMNTSVGFISIGGRVGGEFISVNGSKILTPEGNYEGGIDHNDPILDEIPFSGFGLTYHTGVYFYSNVLEAGLSLGEWPSGTVRLNNAGFEKSTFANLYAEYKYNPDRNSTFSGGVLIKSDFNQVQTDLFAMYRSAGGLIGGVTFRGYDSRSLDAIGLIIGSKINDNFILSYSYDIGISGLRNVHDGSHEVQLSYNLNKIIGIGLPPKIIYNPRFL